MCCPRMCDTEAASSLVPYTPPRPHWPHSHQLAYTATAIALMNIHALIHLCVPVNISCSCIYWFSNSQASLLPMTINHGNVLQLSVLFACAFLAFQDVKHIQFALQARSHPPLSLAITLMYDRIAWWNSVIGAWWKRYMHMYIQTNEIQPHCTKLHRTKARPYM